VNSDIQIRWIGPSQRDLLIAMYDRFDPLGAALGLPPRTAEGRCEWIGSALAQKVNVAAFSPVGEVAGHCFLAADKTASAEMAVFVHQESRRIGVGTALVKAALAWGGAAGLRRVWSVTSSENAAALRLQKNCGFRLTKSVSLEIELEIDLHVSWPACDVRQPLKDLSFSGYLEHVPRVCDRARRGTPFTREVTGKTALGIGADIRRRCG
jgi:GNAT superfamily N-acetyltransferase